MRERELVRRRHKKATNELEERIVGEFGIPARVTTFHSLGFMYVREVFKDRQCFVVDENLRNKIFMDYFRKEVFPYKEKVEEMIRIFNPELLGKNWIFGDFFKKHYREYENFEDYFEAYKRYRIDEQKDLRAEVLRRIEKSLNADLIFTIKGELVKSRSEGLIANFLFCNGIEYRYEKVYKELMDERRVYRPDFTLNVGGEEIYIEYFGLSDQKYEELRKKKEAFHQAKGNRFIALDHGMRKRGDLLTTLARRLSELGVELKPRTAREVFETMLERNASAEFYRFRDFLYEVIDAIKASPRREAYQAVVASFFDKFLGEPGASGEELGEMKRQFEIIDEFYRFYQKRLSGVQRQGVDYSDMIYYANRYFEDLGENENRLHFDYVIIDEYQDISQERYELVKRVSNQDGAKVVAVGDDWQSIYAFSGSRIDYVYNFEQYFPGAKLLKITKTYRNSQELIDVSGDFVMKNPQQIKKVLVSDKRLAKPVKVVEYADDGEYEKLKELILRIHAERPEHKILVLARKNRTIEKCFDDPELKDGIGSKIVFLKHEDIKIEGMSIHASKGLASDEVIVMGLDEGFPGDRRCGYWLKELFKMKALREGISDAEERRVFYVALTRTRGCVYLLVNQDKTKRSKFVLELEGLMGDKGWIL